MKKLLLLISVLLVSFWYTFAITQTVNETNWINYWYIKKVFQKNWSYYLNVDFIQVYGWSDSVLARIEDWDCNIVKWSWIYYTKSELLNIFKRIKTDDQKFQEFFGDKCSFNNSYVRNTNKKIRTYKINTKWKFNVVASCEEKRKDWKLVSTVCTPNDWTLTFTQRYNPTFKTMWNNNSKKWIFMTGAFYSIKLKNSVVTEILEVFQE